MNTFNRKGQAQTWAKQLEVEMERGVWQGGMRALFGGKQAGYLKMIAQTRDDALEQLAEHARSLGANTVLGMRFDSGEFDAGQGQAMNEVTAYGTAVVIEPQ
ncbi:MAG: YbjQ family protein [Acidithiobacillus sp.]